MINVIQPIIYRLSFKLKLLTETQTALNVLMLTCTTQVGLKQVLSFRFIQQRHVPSYCTNLSQNQFSCLQTLITGIKSPHLLNHLNNCFVFSSSSMKILKLLSNLLDGELFSDTNSNSSRERDLPELILSPTYSFHGLLCFRTPSNENYLGPSLSVQKCDKIADKIVTGRFTIRQKIIPQNLSNVIANLFQSKKRRYCTVCRFKKFL